MDPLTQLLMQRATTPNGSGLAQPPPVQPLAQPQPVPVVPPSGGKTHTPPEAQRFANAQQMMNAYRNSWTPNPILLQAANK